MILMLLMGLTLRAQNSPNGPPGPIGNPTPPNNPPQPVPPAPPVNSSEAQVDPIVLSRLFQFLALKRITTIFDPVGNVSEELLAPTMREIANVGGLSTVMSETAQGEAAAINNNLEQRMSQLRDVNFESTGRVNVFLEERDGGKKLGLWVVGTGIFSYLEGTNTQAGTVTAGIDYLIGQHMVLGVLGSYGYSDSAVPGIRGHLLGNSRIGGVYYSAWINKPGLYLALSGLVNFTDFRLLDASNSSLTNWTGFASLGYERACGNLVFGPVASVQFDDAITDGYILSGLGVHHNSTSSVQSRLGGAVSYKIPIKGGSLKPTVQVMWEHHYSGSAAIDVDYVGVPNTLVSVGQGITNRDSAWGSVSLTYHLDSGWAIQGSYNVDLGSNFHTQQVDLGLHAGF